MNKNDLQHPNKMNSFEIVKKCIPLILFAALSIYAGAAFAVDNSTGEDPWLKQYKADHSLLSSTINNKEGEPIKFFNGFSFGLSAGVGLFHGSLADYDMLAPFNEFDTYYNFAWRAYAIREIKWGLSAKIQFETGELTGGRQPGAESLAIDFQTKYNTISAVASFDILNGLFNKDDVELDKYKFYINAEIGIGITMYRSFQFWRESGIVRDYVGYKVRDENPGTQRYNVKTKDKQAVAFNVPVGFTAGYRINYKTDVTFNYTLNNLSTNNLDAFDREYRANDKYSYFGVGLRYNFNREKEQYPKKKVKEKKEKDEDSKWSLFGSKKEDVTPNDISLEEPLESRQSNGVNPSSESKEMEEVRMKMFELQLKLFEMQYLLNGGKTPPPAKTPAK